ncbi:hypothetical protein [Streptomyces sp. MST-110588]|nr:hypothetical protein [Streptomyces sp. MST-110588]UNO38705.1 hypothetical protein KGS77_02380 [Streptomyces sp. MST-110588]
MRARTALIALTALTALAAVVLGSTAAQADGPDDDMPQSLVTHVNFPPGW